MILVVLMAAVLWGIGWAMKAPKQARINMIAMLIFVVVAVQLFLPKEHALRQALGGEPASWALVLGAGGLVWLYARFLRGLRARSKTPAEMAPPRTEKAEGAELARAARHIVLREIGGPGQQRLRNARVLVVGAGGLGCPAMLYLAAGGVGTIGVIDDDVVENTNLQRQVLHRDADIGLAKVFSAKAALEAQNPFVTLRPYNRRLTAEIAEDLFAEYDVILDGSDTYETRQIVNAAAVAQGIPVVWAALSQWEGQVTIFDPNRGAPCFDCVFPDKPADGLAPSCAEGGVFGPLPGVVGTTMAAEAMKLIAGAGTPLVGYMLLIDVLDAQTRKISVSQNSECATCG